MPFTEEQAPIATSKPDIAWSAELFVRRRTRGACLKDLRASDDFVGIGAAFRQLCRYRSEGGTPSGNAVRAKFITIAISV